MRENRDEGIGATTYRGVVATETSPKSGRTGDDKLDRGVLLVAGVVVLGAIMSILDITVVSVAQPTFQNEFDASPAAAAWTMTGYTLALATVVPLSGWAADRFGTKRLYMMAVSLFAAGSALCALATSIEMLTAFRVLQGLGGGMLMPVGMTIMTRAAGPERVGRVMAVLGIPMLLGPIFGPILGGWLIDAASWHWIFLINIPIGVVAFGYASRVLPKDEVAPSETFDWLGMLLLSPGLALFLFGVSSVPGEGTVLAARVLVSAATGLVLIVAFVFRELSARRDHPLIDLHLFTNLRLTIAVVAMAVFAIAFFGASLLFPQYFLLVRGEDTLAAGLLLAPQGIGAMLTMPVAGTLTDRIGPGKIVMTGIVLIVIGMLGFTQVGVGVGDVSVGQSGVTIGDPSYLMLIGSLFVMGLGMGCTMMPIMSSALATLKDHEIARGSTLLNINQQVAASIGTALFSVLLTNGFNGSPEASALRDAAQSGRNFTGGPEALAKAFSDMSQSFATSFIVAVVLVALCLVPVWFLPRKAPAKPVDATAAMMN